MPFTSALPAALAPQRQTAHTLHRCIVVPLCTPLFDSQVIPHLILWVEQNYAASNATIAASRLVSIQRLTALQKAAEERIAALEQQLNSTKAELNSTQAALSDAKSDLDSTIEDMKQLQADLEAARQQVREQLALRWARPYLAAAGGC